MHIHILKMRNWYLQIDAGNEKKLTTMAIKMRDKNLQIITNYHANYDLLLNKVANILKAE